MLAVILKLVLIVTALLMPGGFLLLAGATWWRHRRTQRPLTLPTRQHARIPAGVRDPNLLRACPASMCYRP